MTRLASHIMLLLRQYGAVVLPGLGMLRMRHINSIFDKESGLLYPPTDEIDFIANEEIRDGLLTYSYARKEQSSQEDAANLVEADMRSLQSELLLCGEVNLPGIGTLRKFDGEMEFIPAAESLSFLPKLIFKPEMVEAVSEEPEHDSSVTESFAETVTNNDSERKYNSYRNPRYYYLPIHKGFAKIAACIMLVVVVGISAFQTFTPTTHSSSTASIVPMEVKETPVNKQNTTAGSDFKLMETAAETPVEKSQPVATQKEASAVSTQPVKAEPEERLIIKAEETKEYYAVVAAFKSQAQVEKYISQHPADAGKFKVVKNKNYNLITVSSSTDKDKMEESMPLIRTSYPGAWIFSAR